MNGPVEELVDPEQNRRHGEPDPEKEECLEGSRPNPSVGFCCLDARDQHLDAPV
jgi:hypothetical protein